MSWQSKQRRRDAVPSVHVENAAPRCASCLGMPAVVRVHRDERRKAQRGPKCGLCGFFSEIIVTDDPADKTVVGPGEFGGT